MEKVYNIIETPSLKQRARDSVPGHLRGLAHDTTTKPKLYNKVSAAI